MLLENGGGGGDDFYYELQVYQHPLHQHYIDE